MRALGFHVEYPERLQHRKLTVIHKTPTYIILDIVQKGEAVVGCGCRGCRCAGAVVIATATEEIAVEQQYAKGNDKSGVQAQLAVLVQHGVK